MEFKDWIGDAWQAHGDDARGVAQRVIPEGLPLARSGDDVAALGRLAQHVYGEHLTQWTEGRAVLRQLAAHAHGAGARPTLRVLDASLALAGGIADERASLSASERIRVGSLAAGSLIEHAPRRAGALLRDAVADAEATTLADDDPACRALAIVGNNIACALEGKRDRSGDERALMILAAQTAREYWARAGTWLETERAEYRLAQTWRHAGDLAQARRHAQSCLEIVRANGSPPLEAFFGWEVLGLVERDAGNATGHAHALAQARASFSALDEGDRGWCKPSLDALAATPGAAAS
ncbi:MAG: hypothetical protein U1F54_08530 [Burkholderiales bacterium]